MAPNTVTSRVEKYLLVGGPMHGRVIDHDGSTFTVLDDRVSPLTQPVDLGGDYSTVPGTGWAYERYEVDLHAGKIADRTTGYWRVMINRSTAWRTDFNLVVMDAARLAIGAACWRFSAEVAKR